MLASKRKLGFIFLRSFLILILLFGISFSFVNYPKVVASTNSSKTDFKMIAGSYTGNGTSQSITGLGFQPKVVIIKGNLGGINAVWKSDAMAGETTASLAVAANIATGAITSLDSDGFSVGSHAWANSSGTVYYYIAFGGTSGDLATGSYTGNGTDDRDIIGVGFQPAFVWIKGDVSNQSNVWRSLVHVGDNSSYTANNEDAANLIQDFGSDGFQVGTDNTVSQNAITYYWVAFKDVPSQMQTGSYVGNSTGPGNNDDRDITIASGFKPDYVWDKAAVGFAPATRNLKHDSYAVPVGESLTLFINPNENNHIQTLETNGFQVGTDVTVNEVGVTFHWVGWRHLPDAPTSLGPTSVVNGSTITDTTPSFQYNLNDPILNQVQFRIQIDDSSDFSSPVVDYTSALSSNGTFSFTVGQAAGGGSYTAGSSGQTLSLGIYYWRVLTTNSETAASAYSTANSGSAAFVLAAEALPATGQNNFLVVYLALLCLASGVGLAWVYKQWRVALINQARDYFDQKRKLS